MANNALIIRSKATLSTPKYTLPAPPDLTTGLLYDFVADDLTVAAGAAVPSWPSSAGTKNIALAPHSTSEGRVPGLSVTALPGHKAVRFVAANQQAMTIAAGGFGTAVGMPYTSVVVVKLDTLNNGHIVTGHGTTYLGIRSGDSGKVSLGAGASTAEFSTPGNVDAPGPLADLDWHVVVAVFDGNNSRIHVDYDAWAGPVGVLSPGSAVQAGLRLGSNPGGTSTGPWLDGLIAEARGYSRALTKADVSELVNTLRQTYGLG